MPDPGDEAADADIISSGESLGFFTTSRWPKLARLAKTAGSRRARITVALLAATAVAVAAAAAVWLVPDSPSHPAGGLAQPVRQVTITTTTAGLAAGEFARGTVGGQRWQLAVQDIADPHYRCLPGVAVNGNDADPLFPDPHPLQRSPVGDAAFVTLGPALPGVGFAFIQVPADADWLWLDPAGGFSLGVAPVQVTACGERFHLVGFAYPLARTLRVHAAFTDRAAGDYTVPPAFSAPRASLDDPQVGGVWQNLDVTHGQVAAATIGSGRAAGEHWSIQVGFGTEGDCFTVATSALADSPASQHEQAAACGPVSTPQGPNTIMMLPIGSAEPGGQGVGYAVSVGSATARLVAELSDGSTMSVTPFVVDGRKYAAFFVAGQPHLTWLNLVDSAGRQFARTTGLPGYGYVQFQP